MKTYFQIRECNTNIIVYEWDITEKSKKQMRVFNKGMNRIFNPNWFYTIIVKHK